MAGLFRRLLGTRTTSLAHASVPPTAHLPDTEPPKDRREAICPSCQGELKKVPGAMTKCPHCGELMYVRTDPRVHARVVVTYEEFLDIDEENELRYYDPGELKKFRERQVATNERLRAKFGTAPSSADVRWAELNEDLLEHGAHHDLGLYRNVLYKMMTITRGEGKLKDALNFALDVFYIDLNEPNNLGGATILGEKFISLHLWGPPAPLVPGSLTEEIGDYCDKLGITVERAAQECTERADKMQRALHIPAAWSDLWSKCV